MWFAVAGPLVGAGCLQILDLGPERTRDTPDLTGAGGEGGGGAAASSSSGSSSGGAGGGGGSGGAGCASVEWIVQLGGTGDDFEATVAPDGLGGVYASGTFSGTLEVGGRSLVSEGGSDAFLARFGGAGELLWSKRFGDASSQYGFQLASVPGGGIVLAGHFQGQIDFGGGPFVADFYDSVIAQFDEQGNHVWSLALTGPNYQIIRGLAVDAQSGAVFVTGVFHEELDWGTGQLTTPGDADGFVLRLDAGGAVDWARQVGGAEADYGNGIAAANGRLVVAGQTDGAIDLGEGVLLAGVDGLPDAWVAVYDVDGSPTWTRAFDDPGDERAVRAAFTADGDVVVLGSLAGSLAFGSETVTAPVGAFVARLDPSGAVQQARAIANFRGPVSLSTSTTGNLLLSGFFHGTIDYGGEAFVSMGGDDGVVMALSPTLDPLFHLTIGSSAHDGLSGAVFDLDGGVFALGGFRDSVEIDGCSAFQSAGGADMLLMHLE